ncbi:hypothetical protein Bbelb_380110 [Branchiostoma belcheri]|nr:hypothetical protein Bbelb_380110 [Branchiostoma belcheri]
MTSIPKCASGSEAGLKPYLLKILQRALEVPLEYDLPYTSNINCFADDTSLSKSGPTPQEVASTVNTDLQIVSTWFNDWSLQLHPDKCQVICIKSPQSRVQLPPIYISGQIVEQVPAYTHLGLTVHQSYAGQNTPNLPPTRPGGQWDSCGSYVLEYASILLTNITAAASKILERVQYHAGRLVSGAAARTPYSEILHKLRWDSLATGRDYHRLVTMYKLVNGPVPAHIEPLIPTTRVANSQSQRRLRNAHHLHIPLCRTNVYRDSFLLYTSRLWNRLPSEVTGSATISIFKAKCKHHLLS